MKQATASNTDRVNVAELIARVISSRDVTSILRSAISQTKTLSVTLDFTGVDFISRSAAHAIVGLKEELSAKHEIILINTNDAVKSMLRTVAANRVLPAHSKPQFHAQNTDLNTVLQDSELMSL